MQTKLKFDDDLAFLTNKDYIADVVNELRRNYTPTLHDDLEVYYDRDGNLHDDVPSPTISKYDRSSRSWNVLNNPDYLPPVKNTTFIDAMRLVRVNCGKPRHGWVTFQNNDGRRFIMTFPQFRNLASEMVKGWIIGEWCVRKYYGTYEIYLLEQHN